MSLKTIPTLTEGSLGETKQDNVPEGVVLDKRYYTLAAQYEILKIAVRALCIDVGADDEPDPDDLKSRVVDLEMGGGGGGVPTSRTLTAGAGLTGGGTLAADRTFAVDIAGTNPQKIGTAAPGSSGKVSDRDHVHAIDPASTTVVGAVELATSAECITGTDTTRAVTPEGLKAYVDQVPANVQAAGYALAAADIGAIAFATGAGAQAFTLPTLAGSLVSGKAMILTVQQEGAATVVTITPGASSQIDGAGVGVAFVVGTGHKRVSLFSRDGLAWFSGA